MARGFLAASGHETDMAGTPLEKCGSWTVSVGKSNRLAIETAEALSQRAAFVAALQQGRTRELFGLRPRTERTSCR
jgi:hypothetical protein